MKVKTMISQLQKFDQELEVLVDTEGGGLPLDIHNIEISFLENFCFGDKSEAEGYPEKWICIAANH